MADNYKKLITEIIRKQMDILGPDMALRKTANISGLKVSESGEVESLSGDPKEILQKLVDEYVALSGEIVKNILNPLFQKYPDIKLNL